MSSEFPAERTAIVTGAVSRLGIGRATANRLASRGWSIGVIDLDDGASREFAQELADVYSVKTFGTGADVADQSSAQAAVTRVAEALPQIVALANVAGVSSPVPYLEVDQAEWHRIIDIDLNGVHYVTQPVVRIMAENGLGRIVTISSVSAQRGGGTFGKTAYSTAKAGVLGFSRSLAREFGSSGITVNAVAPGPIDTGIMGGLISDQRREELIAEQLIPRMGTVEDIAAAVDFLLSEDAGFITGQTLSVNGGLYLL